MVLYVLALVSNVAVIALLAESVAAEFLLCYAVMSSIAGPFVVWYFSSDWALALSFRVLWGMLSFVVVIGIALWILWGVIATVALLYVVTLLVADYLTNQKLGIAWVRGYRVFLVATLLVYPLDWLLSEIPVVAVRIVGCVALVSVAIWKPGRIEPLKLTNPLSKILILHVLYFGPLAFCSSVVAPSAVKLAFVLQQIGLTIPLKLIDFQIRRHVRDISLFMAVGYPLSVVCGFASMVVAGNYSVVGVYVVAAIAMAIIQVLEAKCLRHV